MNTVPFENPEPSKFILQIPGITENYNQHLDFGKVKTLSNRSSLKYKGRILKSQERVDLIDKMVESREKYPVRNYADMRKTIDLLQQQFLTNSLYACSHILTSDDEGMELYKTWNDGWEKLSESFALRNCRASSAAGALTSPPSASVRIFCLRSRKRSTTCGLSL